MNIQLTDHGVRAWTLEDFSGKGKALGHTKNKFSDLVKPETPVTPPESSTDPIVTTPIETQENTDNSEFLNSDNTEPLYPIDQSSTVDFLV